MFLFEEPNQSTVLSR
ncbi:hypothetical protein LINPERPRIM_LOCUS4298 [Linum perenne]